MSRTVLWPSPSAWNGVRLDELLPWRGSLDLETRTRAMRLLALYASSEDGVLLPRDIAGLDGSAQGLQFPFNSSLRRYSGPAPSSCANLEVSAPAVRPVARNGQAAVSVAELLPGGAGVSGALQLESELPPLDPTVSAAAAAADTAIPGAAGPLPTAAELVPGAPVARTPGAAAAAPLTPQPVGVGPQPSAATVDGPEPALPAGARPVPPVTPGQSEGSTTAGAAPTLRGERAAEMLLGPPSEPGLANAGNRLGEAASDDVGSSFPRRRLAAAATPLVRITDVVETCEGTRLLITDTVAVPCDLEALMRAYTTISERLDEAAVVKPGMSLAAAYYDWLVRQGVLRQGQLLSEVLGNAAAPPRSGLGRGFARRTLGAALLAVVTQQLLAR